MLDINLKEIEIIDDEISNLEVLKKLVDESGGVDPVHLLDLGDILKKHQTWLQKMPRVIPYFAMKCNPNPIVLKLLGSIGVNFDCATKEEISQVISLGVPSERIIFANPMKFPAHIEYAKKVGVALTTIDHEEEMKKIEEIYPEAKILIRIRCDANVSAVSLGEKFGCDPAKEAISLIKSAIRLGIELRGFSFHTGSPCGEVAAFCRGISICNYLIHIARSLGCETATIIDIGGGIPGERNFDLEEFAGPINEALEEVDSSIEIIAEPGRYYVTSAFTAAARIIGKKIVMKDGQKTLMYYVSDGAYGTFMQELVKEQVRYPVALKPARDENVKYISTVWGPTCSSRDCILKDKYLPEYEVGDWLAWQDVGSYGTCFSTVFNGLRSPKVLPIIRKSDWESTMDQLPLQQNQISLQQSEFSF